MEYYRRRRRIRRVAIPAIALAGAALLGAAIGVGPSFIPAPDPITTAPGKTIVRYAEPLSGCTVTDGDTIRCGDERIRLLGIDSPEKPGNCRNGRVCAPGDPYASTESLLAAMVGPLTIERVGTDRYGRTLGMVAGAKGDLSCWQLERGQAIYKSGWDDGYRVGRACPLALR